MVGSNAAPQGEFGLLKRVVLAKITQKLQEPDIPWQVVLTHAAKHAQIRLEQRKETLRPILVHVTPGVLFLGVMDALWTYPFSAR